MDDHQYPKIDLDSLRHPIGLAAEAAAEVREGIIATPSHGSCFRFDDGTTQGWTLDQAYASGAPYNKLTIVGGFTLSNRASLALRAKADPFVVTDLDQSGDIYLESPDLSQDAAWQGIKGYSLDLHAWFWSAKYALPSKGQYFVQLQVRALEPDGTPHLYAEWHASTNDFVFHDIENGKPHHIAWKAATFDEIVELGYKVVRVRVRLTTPLIHEWEGGVHAEWLIGNVCSEV